MGSAPSTDIFQSAMSKLFHDMESVIAYMDDLMCLEATSFEAHIKNLDEILTRLGDMGLQINPKKTAWLKGEVDYLGFTITREGIKPQMSKIQGILDMEAPTSVTQIRSFVGMVNFYKTMWPKRSTTLAPLTDLTGKGQKFKWETKHQKAFEKMKGMMAQDTLLSFPDPAQSFDLHTDASDKQIGAVLSQGGKPLGFFSKKFNVAQRKYTVTEKELLAITEALKHFRIIVKGRKVTVWTDHKNLISKTADFGSDRVLRQRLILEEYGVKIEYLKGETNQAADAVSRIPCNSETVEDYHELFAQRRVFQDTQEFPLGMELLAEKQRKCQQLQKALSKRDGLFIKKTVGEVEIFLIQTKNKEQKIYVPVESRAELLEWYHENLIHPGIDKMANTIGIRFAWPGMTKDIKNYVNTCTICQMYKKVGGRKYGKIPFTDDKGCEPWSKVQTDLIGPWTVKFRLTKESKVLETNVSALTIMDKATRWPEFHYIDNKTSKEISRVFDQEWLCRYPRPEAVIFDNGGEFVGFEFQ